MDSKQLNEAANRCVGFDRSEAQSRTYRIMYSTPMSVEERVAARLRDALSGNTLHNKGLCGHLKIYSNAHAYNWFARVVKEWPEFSGDVNFPVPSPTDSWSSAEYYFRTDDLWIGEYGASRLRLAKFLLGRLEAGEKICDEETENKPQTSF